MKPDVLGRAVTMRGVHVVPPLWLVRCPDCSATGTITDAQYRGHAAVRCIACDHESTTQLSARERQAPEAHR